MLTIDIEDNAINLLEIQGKSIKTFVSKPLEPGLIKDGVILNPELVGEMIKALLTENKIAERTAVTSVSGVHSIYRIARLPKIKGDLMHEAVRREMTRLIPVPLEELHASWQQIPISDAESIIPMIGVPRETVDFTLSALKQAGVDSKIIDVRPLAIARVVDEKDAIIINVQPFSFDIVLMVDGVPEIVRSLSFSETLVSPEDKVKEIREELERTFNFYNNSKPAKPLGEGFVVFISGTYKDILAKSMQYKVKPLPLPYAAPSEFDQDTFVVNLGLSLKSARPGSIPVRVNINVLPEVYRPKPVALTSIISWALLVVGIGLLGLMAFNWQGAVSHTQALQNEINKIDKQAAAANANKGNVDNIQKQIQQIKSERAGVQAVLDKMSENRNLTSGELGEVIALMPGEITIKSIDMGNGWTINGSARTPEIVFGYAYAMQGSAKFRDVKLGTVKMVDFNKWEFTITAESVHLVK
jgi:type IV pilus assembly protein PilM